MSAKVVLLRVLALSLMSNFCRAIRFEHKKRRLHVMSSKSSVRRDQTHDHGATLQPTMPAPSPPAASSAPGHAAAQSPPEISSPAAAANRHKKNDNLRLFRLGTLFALMLMNGVDTVLRRYSQGILKETYSVNEVLMVAECLKMTFSAYMISRFGGGSDNGGSDAGGKESKHKSLTAELVQLLLQSRKMIILVMLYGAGNSLSYYALARIGAGSFVVIANLKTLLTAAFSVLLLGRTYSWTQWRALILLVCGVVLFVLPTLEEKSKVGEDETSGKLRGIMAGCVAELVVVTISGFASIYFELAIKRDAVNIWGRNFQLGFYSVLMYLILRSLEKQTGDGEADDAIAKTIFRPFFIGWSPLAVVLSTGMACGGILVALCIKYGDSILKTLAVSGSILLASIADHYVLGGPLTVQMCIAGVVVIIAIINYAFDSSSATPAPRASKSPNNDVENSTEKETNAEGDTKDDWQENEPIDMQPLVKTGEAANRRTNIPV